MPLFGPPVATTGALDFVEVDGAGTTPVEAPDVEPPFELPRPSPASGEPGWSLWADLEA
jgi:hypothetical protein